MKIRSTTNGTRPRRKRGIVAIAVAVMAVTTALVATSPDAQPAEAGFAANSGQTGCNGVNMGGYVSLGFRYLSLSSAMTSAEDWSRSNNINPTDIETYGTSAATADVVVRDLDYASYCGFDWFDTRNGGTTGLTTCDSVLPWSSCGQHTIRFSTVYTNVATTSQRRALACHENGHAIGLTHATSDTTCMKPNVVNPPTTFNPTEIGWINNAY